MRNMTTEHRAGAAIAAAFSLVILAATPTIGHQAHKKQAAEAASEVVPPEPAATVRPEPPVAEPHEHADHASAALPAESGVTLDAPQSDAPVSVQSDPPAAKPHDHADHGPAAPGVEGGASPDAAASNVPKPLAWLGKFHPPLTHFPIALIIAGAIAEILFIRTRNPLFEHATRFSIWLGAGGAVAAALLGWLFAGFHVLDDEWVMTAHRWFGTATALWAGYLLFVSERTATGDGSRSRFRFALFAGAALVSITGFLGGSLLYGLDHFAW